MNSLANSGTINGSLVTPLALPVVATLPQFQIANPGGNNVNAQGGQAVTISPGQYRAVVVQNNAPTADAQSVTIADDRLACMSSVPLRRRALSVSFATFGKASPGRGP